MPGPYVQLAAICEKALQEADGTLSLIRVVDRITLSTVGGPDELPENTVVLTFVVSLKPDDALGRHPMAIDIQEPSGAFQPERTFDVLFEGKERGVTVILELQLATTEGLYWFDVSVSGNLLTRIPLRVIYQRLPAGL